MPPSSLSHRNKKCVRAMVSTQILWRGIAPPFAFSHPLAGDFHPHCQLRVCDGCWSPSHSIRVLTLGRRTAEEQERLLAVSQSSSVCSPLTVSMCPWPPASVERRVPKAALYILTLCICNRVFTHSQYMTHVCSLTNHINMNISNV